MFGKNNNEEVQMDNESNEVTREVTFESVSSLHDASPEQIERALALFNKDSERKAKVKAGIIKGGKKYSEMTEEEKEKDRQYNRRRNTYNKLMIAKAAEAGITVSDEEVDEELRKMGKL